MESSTIEHWGWSTVGTGVDSPGGVDSLGQGQSHAPGLVESDSLGQGQSHAPGLVESGSKVADK